MRSRIRNLPVLFKIINTYGVRHSYGYIRYKRPHLWNKIQEYRKRLEFNATFTETMYCLMYGLTKRPLCLTCGQKPCSFRGFDKGYAMFCGHSCVGKSAAINDKRKKTLQAKYGVDSPVALRWNRSKMER